MKSILSLGAVVAMNETYIFVRESVGSIEICAHVENRASVAFPFNISLDFDSLLNSASVY